jgi:hypothetical protein
MRPRNPPLKRFSTLIATVIATLIAKVIATLIATADNAILARLRRRSAETLAGAMGHSPLEPLQAERHLGRVDQGIDEVGDPAESAAAAPDGGQQAQPARRLQNSWKWGLAGRWQGRGARP